MSQHVAHLIKQEIDHEYRMPFIPSYSMLRSLYQEVTERPEEEPFGVALAHESHYDLFLREAPLNWVKDREEEYEIHPQAWYYYWDGQQLTTMDWQTFFSTLRKEQR